MTPKLAARSVMAGSITSALGALALCATTLGASVPALAETLAISATGLVLRCPCTGGGEDIAEENKGVFVGQKPDGRYFVPVVFPVTSGQKVCSFTMIYHDVNALDTLVARLYRKTYFVGSSAFNPPTLIAKVQSDPGTPDTVRKVTTTAIAGATISVASSFYYIEADVKTTNLDIIGFQIVYKPTCP